jgi:hypothetical protein
VQVQVLTTDLARAAITDPAAASTDLVAAPKRKTWIARHRTGRVVVKRVNASKTFNAAAAIDLVAEDSAVVVAAGSGGVDEN